MNGSLWRMAFMTYRTVLLWIFFWLSAYAEKGHRSGELRRNSEELRRTVPTDRSLLCTDFKDVQQPPAPILSWSPSDGLIARGKPIRLTCSLPEGQKSEFFYFYQMKDGRCYRLNEQAQNILEVPTLQLLKQKETFVCAYWGEKGAGRSSLSQLSNQAVFSVTELPPLPSLSADPLRPLYLPGDKVILQCSAPRDAQGMQYHFYHLGVGHSSEKHFAPSGSAQLTVTATRENSGLYSCRYSESGSERNAFSESSRPIRISVIDPPPRPVLTVDPPSGELNESDPLFIACLVNGSNTEKKFHFYKDGVEINSSIEEFLRSTNEIGGVSSNATVSTSKAKPSHSGEFACSYEEKTNVSWIRSPWSQKVNVTVRAPNSPASSSLLYKYLRIPFVILMFSLAFYCWRRKKTGASKHKQRSQPGEQKEETDLGTLEPRMAASQADVNPITGRAQCQPSLTS